MSHVRHCGGPGSGGCGSYTSDRAAVRVRVCVCVCVCVCVYRYMYLTGPDAGQGLLPSPNGQTA